MLVQNQNVWKKASTANVSYDPWLCELKASESPNLYKVQKIKVAVISSVSSLFCSKKCNMNEHGDVSLSIKYEIKKKVHQ